MHFNVVCRIHLFPCLHETISVWLAGWPNCWCLCVYGRRFCDAHAPNSSCLLWQHQLNHGKNKCVPFTFVACCMGFKNGGTQRLLFDACHIFVDSFNVDFSKVDPMIYQMWMSIDPVYKAVDQSTIINRLFNHQQIISHILSIIKQTGIMPKAKSPIVSHSLALYHIFVIYWMQVQNETTTPELASYNSQDF